MALKRRTSLFLKGIDAFACTSFPLGLSLQAIYADATDKQLCHHRALWSLWCWCFVSTGLATANKLQQHAAYPNGLGFREHYRGAAFSCCNATHYSIRLFNFSSLHLLQLAFSKKDFPLPPAFKRTLLLQQPPVVSLHKEDTGNLNLWHEFLK